MCSSGSIGVGINGFKYKKDIVLDVGNSGTLGRLIAGLLVHSKNKIKLIGDKSLSKRDFLRITKPLEKFGAIFRTSSGKLPITIKGTNFAKPVFYIAFAGMLLNIPLDLIFVYGYFGAPKLGGVGCGIATSIVSFIMMISIFIYINTSKNYKKTEPFAKFTLPSMNTTKEVFKLGLPIGLGIFIELSMFSGAAIILSVLGEIVVASHSVAINIASLFFMVPLAIGLASSTRVGNLIGEKNPKQAKVAATSTIMLCMTGAMINSIIIILFGSFIVSLYTTELPVLELAISLIFFAAIFQLPDGIQMGALGSLRGYKDTFIPMILLQIGRAHV